MRQFRTLIGVTCILVCMSAMAANGFDKDMKVEITAKDRCSVCGMFVAKYPLWITILKMSDGTAAKFDGPKDMLVYYFSAEEYGGKTSDIIDVAVKDYYTQKWIDGRHAFYVAGSDVYGPMGHEFIPFQSREAAENFMKDHKGKEILAFDEITRELVESMRTGHKMKGHMKKQ